MQPKLRHQKGRGFFNLFFQESIIHYKYILMRNRRHFLRKLCYIIKHMLC